MKPAETVHRFLRSIGHGSEAEFYLSLFRSEAKESFATIAVDSSILDQALNRVVFDLRFLNELELIPVVVLGLYHPNVARRAAHVLQKQLKSAGIPCVEISSTADITEICAVARKGSIPLVPIDSNDDEDRFVQLAQMLTALSTRKLIFLQAYAGLRRNGELISVVNLSKEFDVLKTCRDFSPSQIDLIERSHQLIFERIPHKILIAITSPLNLLHELFTVKGAGTLLRKGVRIQSYQGYTALDPIRLESLLVNSFDHPLSTDFFSRPISRVYVEENYRGAALLLDTDLGGYLTKFAVTREAQGEGIGHDLWQCVVDDYATIIWRAKPDNPITTWYEKQCDGLVRLETWTVYFRGLKTALIPEAIRFSLDQPHDF